MRISSPHTLSRDEHTRLIIALEEMKARGLSLPEVPDTLLRPSQLRWPLDPRGYFVSNEGKIYNPTEQQGKFIKSSAAYDLFYSGRGGGKTAAGSQKALLKIMDGEDGAVMNPSFENFKISTWPEFRSWIPWDMVIPSQRHRSMASWQPHQPFVMVFVNGVKVYCKGLKNPDSARGPNINWLWYDEAGMDSTGESWKIAIASVRVGKSPQRWATTTPKGLVHWLYKFFIEKDIPAEALEAFEKASGGDRILVENFHGTIHDNRENLDPEFYAATLASYPAGWIREQELEGEFANEGGKIGDRHWFDGHILDKRPDDITKRVRFWDLAATEKKVGIKANDPDETVGSLLSKSIDTIAIEEQIGGYWSWKQIKEMIVHTAIMDGPYVLVRIEQEPAAGGKNQVAELVDTFKETPELRSHNIKGVLPKDVGDRVMAANAWFAWAAAGRMFVVKGLWNNKFYEQLDGFGMASHDDRITSVSGAFHELNPFRSWKKIPFFKI